MFAYQMFTSTVHEKSDFHLYLSQVVECKTPLEFPDAEIPHNSAV